MGNSAMTYRDSLVSVVIPVYNAAAFLDEAIASVWDQTYRPIEVILVDDGSTDGSAAVAARHGAAVRYHYQENARIVAARNQGVHLATGELLAFLDADDLWPPDKLAGQVEALKKHPQVNMVFGHMEHFFSPELDEAARARIKLPEGEAPSYCAGAMLVRRASFDRVGAFATQWRVGEFVDWYQRALHDGLQPHMLPQVVVRRRIHATNTTRSQKDATLDYVRILRAGILRQRQAQDASPDLPAPAPGEQL